MSPGRFTKKLVAKEGRPYQSAAPRQAKRGRPGEISPGLLYFLGHSVTGKQTPANMCPQECRTKNQMRRMPRGNSPSEFPKRCSESALSRGLWILTSSRIAAMHCRFTL